MIERFKQPTLLWKDKLIELLHDPWDKVFDIRGHQRTALHRMAELLGRPELENWTCIFDTEADEEAAGADRPAFRRGDPSVPWLEEPILTHPLGGRALRLELPGLPPTSPEWLEALVKAAGIRSEDPDLLRAGHLWLWRRLPEELVGSNGTTSSTYTDAPWRAVDLKLEQAWRLLPADSRIPDHSIWDHVRMASAWVGARNRYLREPKARGDKTNPPHLLSIKVGSAQRFISEARKSRDLWIGSYLLADLTLHALLPIVETLGPDAILYPSLFGNPFFDQWLCDHGCAHRGEPVLPEAERPLTYSSMLPNKFLALVPAQLVERLTDAAARAVEARWTLHAEKVRRCLEGRLKRRSTGNGAGSKQWQQIWGRQLMPPSLQWTAVPWEGFDWTDYEAGEPLSELSAWYHVPDHERDRQRRIWQVWLSTGRQRNKPSYLINHRAFTYPATHHELLLRMKSLGSSFADPLPAPEEGIKCHVDGWREVLREDVSSSPSIGELRAASERFWHRIDSPSGADNTRDRSSGNDRTSDSTALNSIPAAVGGTELMSGMSALRRYLVYAEGEEAMILRDQGQPPSAIREQLLISRFSEDLSRGARAPFPSTHTLAGGAWLECLVTKALGRDFGHPGTLQALIDVLNVFNQRCGPLLRKLGEDTQRIDGYRALQRLLVRAPVPLRKVLEPWLCYDLEWMLPEAWERLKEEQLEKVGVNAGERDEAVNAARSLKAFAEALAGQLPRGFAVLVMDGDRMGDLLLGLERRIEARYEDVLHPRAIEKLRQKPDFVQAGWPGILPERRLMTPSLHAFTTRALAHFAYEVVPWLVEERYHGRLVYAGGDDLLALVPVEEATALAQDIKRHFSASWLEGGWEYHQRRDVAPEPVKAFRFVDERESDGDRTLRGTDPLTIDGRRRIIPMLGEAGSISAAIVMAHVKTPLRPLIRRAQHLLEVEAKGTLGRDAVVISRFTRGGEKLLFGGSWRDTDGRWLLDLVHKTRDAFRGGDNISLQLAGRLPYRLRERAAWLEASGTTPESPHWQVFQRLLPGLVRDGLERSGAATDDASSREWIQAQAAALEYLIRQGLNFAAAREVRQGRRLEQLNSLDGVFLSRFLSTTTVDEQE